MGLRAVYGSGREGARRGSKVISSCESTKTAVKPAVIVGGGRLGNALQQMGDGEDVLIGRDGAIPENHDGPVFVCTRNNDLDAVVHKTPASKRNDLVFVQNGMLLPWLRSHGLEHNTQALIYFAVAKMGEEPTDGVTDKNPEGLTSVWGKWADALRERLNRSGLACHVQNENDFKASMFEKLIWICAYMLIGQKHGCTVGEVEQDHADEVCSLVRELCDGAARVEGVQFKDGTEERLQAYSRSVAHFPTAVKEFEWRNGYFYNLSAEALNKGNSDPFPQHTQLLKEAGVVSL